MRNENIKCETMTHRTLGRGGDSSSGDVEVRGKGVLRAVGRVLVISGQGPTAPWPEMASTWPFLLGPSPYHATATPSPLA